MTGIRETYGNGIELDTPYSEYQSIKLDFDQDVPFLALGIKSSEMAVVASEISKACRVSLDVT